MAALLEEALRVRFLKVAGADFAAWDVGCECKYGRLGAMTVVEAVDEVKVTWSTTAGADGEISA